MAGLEDRHRSLVVDGIPVATGVVAVGDAWACTNPSLGRGASIGLAHACALRDVLRDVGADDVSCDPEKLVRRFDEVTAAVVEPLYRMTLWFDRCRLAEIAADAGTPGQTDDPRWAVGKALFAASLADQDLAREYLSIALLLSTPDEVFARPGMAERVMRLGAHAPRYPCPGRTGGNCSPPSATSGGSQHRGGRPR
jgi:2-polyprenyl-6-methoxyphenol hydroxylase-like FAD-dependent oxidoreductase